MQKVQMQQREFDLHLLSAEPSLIPSSFLSSLKMSSLLAHIKKLLPLIIVHCASLTVTAFLFQNFMSGKVLVVTRGPLLVRKILSMPRIKEA